MECLFVDSAQGLSSVVERIAGEARIAVDFEGDGLFRYRSRVCTMQLRAADLLVVVDTLAHWDTDVMQALLGATGPTKVIHDAAFDARLLWDRGVRLGNIFDTAIAARFLAEPATGLASLLSKRCGVEIQKDQQQSDWGKRPLTADALRYLHDDVRHLMALRDSLLADVELLAIGSEVAVECEYVLSQACQPPPPPKPPWLRIKGARRQPPAQRGVLRELALVRERAAQDWDVPPFKVAHDRVLIELARRQPASIAELRSIRSFKKGRAMAIAQAFLAAVSRGLSAGDAPDSEREEQGPVGPAVREQARVKKLREKRLSSWRAGEASTRGVDPQVVLPGHGLQDLAQKAPASLEELGQVDGLGAVRVDRYGAALLAVIADAAAAGALVDQ